MAAYACIRAGRVLVRLGNPMRRFGAEWIVAGWRLRQRPSSAPPGREG
jgi:hypothetical protein